MKTDTMKAKATAALAARNNVLPDSRDAAWILIHEIGLDSQFLGVDYGYDFGAYLPKLCSSGRSHKPTRKMLTVLLYRMAIAKEIHNPAKAVKDWMGTNPLARWKPAALFNSLADRARARPLTPKARNYRSAIGIEIEGFSAMTKAEVIPLLPIYANAVHDGSIRAPHGQNPIEINALLNRDEMEPKLFRLCAALSKVGFGVNKSCGLHVHLDARHLSFDSVCQRAKIVDKWLKALRELVPLSRQDNSYCAFGFSRTERYRAVNVTSHSKHRTLEIRLHSSTINYQKVLAWIRLIELLFSIGKAPKVGLGCMATLDCLPLADYERSYWRARHVQLNPSSYQNAVASTGDEE